MVIAVIERNNNLKEKVKAYNESNIRCEITIKEYYRDENNNTLSYEESLEWLKNDIMRDDSIDMVSISDINPRDISGYDMFEDLYKYIEQDAVLSKNNYNYNILKLYEDNGSLMAIPAKFAISGLASEKSLLGEEALTLDKFLEIRKTNQDKEIYNYRSRSEALETLIATNISYLVDINEKKCRFNDGNFEKMLEIVSGFETEQKSLGAEEEINLMEGKTLFSNHWFSCAEEYGYYFAVFGDNFKINGYPTVDGNGLRADVCGTLITLNKNSKNKEESWKFINSIYSKQYVSESELLGFSVVLDEMEKQLDRICAVNAPGDGTESKYYMQLHYGDLTLKYPYISENQKNELREILLSVNLLTSREDIICKIVNEEAEEFFSGSKSAAEVSEAVQSRAEQYVNEKN